MKNLNLIIRNFILFLTLFLFLSVQNNQQYPTKKNGDPTKYGISFYLKQNEEKLISEYQKLVHDTLYDVYITVDDLSKYSDNTDDDVLGYCITGGGKDSQGQASSQTHLLVAHFYHF